ncbi:MAG: hypothetical protein GF411_01430 [Candidatus Lokiarchaeota archaeon]|nr:hypothetical protein [Candidatus Lokiarchaeota archaeon]
MMIPEEEKEKRLKTYSAICCIEFIVILLVGFLIDFDNDLQFYIFMAMIVGFSVLCINHGYNSLIKPEIDLDKLKTAEPYLQGETIWSNEVIQAPLSDDAEYLLKLSKDGNKYGILKRGDSIEVIDEIPPSTIELFSNPRNLDAFLYYKIEEHTRLRSLIKSSIIIGVVWFVVGYWVLSPLFQILPLSFFNWFGILESITIFGTLFLVVSLRWIHHLKTIDTDMYLQYTEFVEVLEILRDNAPTSYKRREYQEKLDRIREQGYI